MFVNTLILVVAVAVVSGQGGQLEQDCHILQSLDDIMSRLDSAESDVTNLKSSLTNAEIQVTDLKSSLTSTDTQVANLKTSLTTAETEISTLQDSLATAETTIENLINSQTESPLTPSVLFHVRDVAPQPTANNVILFQNVVENVGDAYNIFTGCFNAPIGGAYWFNAQICTHIDRRISPSLYIQGNVVSRVVVYDENFGTCGSVTAVVTLEIGDTVCLKSGQFQHTDPVWGDHRINSNNFMGAIINWH